MKQWKTRVMEEEIKERTGRHADGRRFGQDQMRFEAVLTGKGNNKIEERILR